MSKLAHYFRRYDIRGIVDDCFNHDFAYWLGLAFAQLLKTKNIPMSVLVGRDGRDSSPLFAHRFIQGLRQMGVSVTDVGCVATPIVYFGCYYKDKVNAVMITGSHNPVGYNGFKIIFNKRSITEEEITHLHDLVQSFQQDTPTNAKELNQITSYAVEPDYIDYIQKQIKLKRPYKIVVDAGNGMASKIAPDLYRALGCEVIELFCVIDGTFPNHHPDPSKPANMRDLQNAVLAHNADIGFAFDGDADRIGVITRSGENMAADYVLAVLAHAVLEKNENKGASIVFDVKCSKVLIEAIKKSGGEPVMWQTGHSLIKQKMLAINAPIAGELSGHIFFYDRWFGVDDAIYAGARLLEVLDNHTNSDELFAKLPRTCNSPELNMTVSDASKQVIMQKLCKECVWQDAIDIVKIDGMRVIFSNGWGLIRASNTTPMLVLRFEADSLEALHKIIRVFCAELTRVCPELDVSPMFEFIAASLAE